MNEFAEVAQSIPLIVGISLILVACLAAWTAIARRPFQGRPLVRYEGRRAVPWGGIDVLAIFVAYVLFSTAAVAAGTAFWGIEFPPLVVTEAVDLDSAVPQLPADQLDREDLDAAHTLLVLLHDHHNPTGLLLCLFSAVIVAPIVEEFLFRLVFQGWCERLESRLRTAVRIPVRLIGMAPVMIASALFGASHYRQPGPLPDADSLVKLVVLDGAAKIAVLVFGVALLRWRCGAGSEDFGIRPSRFGADVRLGLVASAAVIVPVYALQALFSVILGPDVVPDPLTLFFLALVFGFLYFRTHRLTPAIVLHATFNAVAVALAWATLGNS